MSHYTLGTDEAGYGPNLGPLVISATLWNETSADFGDLLADSKKLYASHASLARLEHGVLGAIQSSGEYDLTWNRLRRLVVTGNEAANELPLWEKGVDFHLPRDAEPYEVDAASHRFVGELIALKSRIIQPGEFNRLLRRDANKSTLLTRETLRLAARLLDQLPQGAEVTVYSDKHGGRNTYVAPLYELFPDATIMTIVESRPVSSYRIESAEHRINWHFSARGESRREVALASMLSKYLRELSMAAWNTFWQRHVPELLPTAGYPADARRFAASIDAARRQLGIDECDIWREK